MTDTSTTLLAKEHECSSLQIQYKLTDIHITIRNESLQHRVEELEQMHTADEQYLVRCISSIKNSNSSKRKQRKQFVYLYSIFYS